MLRERINSIFNNKVLYLVISIVAAFSLWVYVTNVDNQNTETTIRGIAVNFVGREALEAKGLVIDDNSDYSVALRFLGKRDTVLRLRNTNININIDVSDITTAGTFDKFYSVSMPSSVNSNEVYVLKKDPEYVTVRVIQYVSKTVGVKGGFSGTMKEGFEAKPLTFAPASITVRGPEEIVSRVSYAYVKLSQSDVAGNVLKSLPFVLMDKDGVEISTNKLSVSNKAVEVTLPVIQTKRVALALKLNPGGGADASNVKYLIDPKTITLSGDPEVLGKINELYIKTYNLAELFSDDSVNCEIPIPSGLTNVTGIKSALVSISVTGLATKDINVSNIKIQNVYAGHKATLATKDISVTIRGEKSAIEAVTADNIMVIIDLNELGQSVGKYSVPVKIEISGASKVGAIGTYTASVILEAT